MHAILCDAIDSGKSSFVCSLVRRLTGRGARLSGWVTPAFMEGWKKAGHDFVAIDGDRVETPVPFTRLHPFEGSVSFPDLTEKVDGEQRASTPCPFHFNATAFRRAAEIVDSAARFTIHDSRLTDLFVMDEIGPLELSMGLGFRPAMLCAFMAGFATLTVVRRGLEAPLRSILPELDFTVYSLREAGELEERIGELSLPL